MVWGSPNYNDPNNTNTVTFFGPHGGVVTADDLYGAFSGIDNDNHPGYLISFFVPGGFTGVEFTTTGQSSDFEFAVTGVPEPSTWALLLIGFAGLGFAGYRSSRKTGATVAA